MFRITIFNLVQQPQCLNGGMLITGRTVEVKGWSGSGSETIPPVIPSAVILLISDDSFDPSAFDFLGEPGFKDKSHLLDIYIYYRHIAGYLPGDSVAKLLDKAVCFFI